jgi:hypothetical protein
MVTRYKRFGINNSHQPNNKAINICPKSVSFVVVSTMYSEVSFFIFQYFSIEMKYFKKAPEQNSGAR